LIVNNNDNLVEVRKIKLSLLRVSILQKENSAQDKKSLCVREKIGIMDNLSKKKKVDCVNHRCERVGGCGLELGMFGRGVQ
jgi:hypothetical protein